MLRERDGERERKERERERVHTHTHTHTLSTLNYNYSFPYGTVCSINRDIYVPACIQHIYIFACNTKHDSIVALIASTYRSGQVK